MFVPVSASTDAFERQDDSELASVLGRILFGVSEPTFRAERLVLAPDIAARLERDGQAIGRITHFEGGSAEIELVPIDGEEDGDTDPLHPFGACTCGYTGACEWCLSTCQGCGGETHDGECPAFEDVYPELSPS